MDNSSDIPLEEVVVRLMDTYGEDVYKLAFLYMRNQQSAEDVHQEVFYKVMKSYHKFKHESSEKTWLFRITINTCKDMLKQSWFRRVSIFDSEEKFQKGYELPVNMEEKETNQGLYELILKMPSRYREVILLYYYEDLTYEEVANILHIPQGTVQSRLSRGRQKLKKMMEESGEFHGSGH